MRSRIAAVCLACPALPAGAQGSIEVELAGGVTLAAVRVRGGCPPAAGSLRTAPDGRCVHRG